MNRPNFDKHINDLFTRCCPDAARFLNSWNPIARHRAREDRHFFTIGLITHLNFTEDDEIAWDVALVSDVCPGCDFWDENEVCDHDPADCEQFEKLTNLYTGERTQ